MFAESFKIGKRLLKKIESHQFQAYFVGGCVRDLLLERPIGDIDIATSASPAQIKQIFCKIIPIGIEHGTVIVRYEHQSFEVTTFRVEDQYEDKRHPNSVKFIDEINLDLGRRDFTINALAMNHEGEIIDLFAGKTDLKNKNIRAVGNGYDRFAEDPLRIVRALRFSSELGFTIEKETLRHMTTLKDTIKIVATERITSEFTKFFAGTYVNLGLNYLINTNIYRYLPIMTEYPSIINKLPRLRTPLLSFGEVISLFHCVEPSIPISRWINDWKCSNKVKFEVSKLTASIKRYESVGLDAWLVYQLTPIYVGGFVRIINLMKPNANVNHKQILQLQLGLTIHSKDDMAIGGHDLLHLFPNLKKGPWIGSMINTLERKIVLNELPNTNSELKEWIKCNPPEIN